MYIASLLSAAYYKAFFFYFKFSGNPDRYVCSVKHFGVCLLCFWRSYGCWSVQANFLSVVFSSGTCISIPCAFVLCSISVALLVWSYILSVPFPPFPVTSSFFWDLLCSFSSTEPFGFKCDGCSSSGAWCGELLAGFRFWAGQSGILVPWGCDCGCSSKPYGTWPPLGMWVLIITIVMVVWVVDCLRPSVSTMLKCKL